MREHLTKGAFEKLGKRVTQNNAKSQYGRVLWSSSAVRGGRS